MDKEYFQQIKDIKRSQNVSEGEESAPAKKSQADRIIDLLLERFPRWATSVELNEICFRYGGRFKDLREDGWAIENLRNWDIPGNVWCAWLEEPTRQNFPYIPKYHKDDFEIRDGKIVEKASKKSSVFDIFQENQRAFKF